MGGSIIWLIIMIPCSAVFTGLGIYAMKIKKPMWFWTGSTVKEEEIRDIPAYNRANGIMWIVFSLIFWASAFLGLCGTAAAVIVLIGGMAVGIPLLVFTYNQIYKKYKA